MHATIRSSIDSVFAYEKFDKFSKKTENNEQYNFCFIKTPNVYIPYKKYNKNSFFCKDAYFTKSLLQSQLIDILVVA